MNPSGQPTNENAMWSEYIDQNTAAETAHLVVEADRALLLRESIEDGAAPTRAESFTESGKPRGVRAPGRGAALAQRYRETVLLSSPPPAVQRLLFPLLARFTSAIPSRRRLGRR